MSCGCWTATSRGGKDVCDACGKVLASSGAEKGCAVVLLIGGLVAGLLGFGGYAADQAIAATTHSEVSR